MHWHVEPSANLGPSCFQLVLDPAPAASARPADRDIAVCSKGQNALWKDPPGKPHLREKKHFCGEEKISCIKERIISKMKKCMN